MQNTDRTADKLLWFCSPCFKSEINSWEPFQMQREVSHFMNPRDFPLYPTRLMNERGDWLGTLKAWTLDAPSTQIIHCFKGQSCNAQWESLCRCPGGLSCHGWNCMFFWTVLVHLKGG